MIAEYLKRKEPQNPVSYLVERAVRWSKMPLEQWLGEVVQNDEVLFRLRDTLGIKGKKRLDSSEAKGVFLAWCETVISGLIKELHVLFNFILFPVDKL